MRLRRSLSFLVADATGITPAVLECDVLVCGGGTAGAVAGIKAARLGAKTLLIEELSALGGTQTMGWVTPMMPNYLGGRQLSTGLNLEIQAEHAFLSPPTDFENAQVWYNPVVLSAALERLADRAGLQIAFNTSVRSLALEGSKVESLTLSSPGGDWAVRAKIVIDATGDADVVHAAGGLTESGGAGGRKQPLTLRFNLANVDISAVLHFFSGASEGHGNPNREDFLHIGYAEAKQSPIADAVREAIQTGILEEDDLGYFQFFTMLGRPRELAFNCPRIVGFDPLDPFERSRALVIGRQKILRIHNFCKRFLPGFENCYISVIAPLLGIRETRRIVGLYTLTEDDHQTCRKFDDAVARNRYPIDIHLAEGGVELKKLPANDYHEIPYRCLVPRDLDNVLVAGRCLSATFAAQSSVRIQPVCRALGEAAGAAAALCSEHNLRPRDLSYELLRPHIDLSVGLENTAEEGRLDW